MGRPRKEGMDYFPHDVDASSDEKLEAMRSMFGNDGYAFYFIVLERIYRTEQAELDISKDIYLFSIAKRVLVPVERFLEMIHAAIDVGLFDADVFYESKKLTSSGIKKRFNEINLLRNKWRNIKENKGLSFPRGKGGGKLEEKGVENATKESKGKESKVKESKVKKNKYSDYVTMTDAEFDKLVEQFGDDYAKLCIVELDNYKGATGKKYTSDYRAILSWVTKRVDENLARQSKPMHSQPKPHSQKPQMQMAEPQKQSSTTMTPEELQQSLELAKLLDTFKP